MKAIELDQFRPHKNARVRCMNCLFDWIATFPSVADPFTLQCPDCEEMKSLVLEYLDQQ